MASQIDPTVLGRMTKLQRINAALRNAPVDRPPVSLWRHFYECEQTAEDLAGAMLAWHKKYDWDWMKINPRATYHVEGWGVQTRYGGPNDRPQEGNHPISSLRDWAKIRPLPLDTPVLDEQLEAVERICEALGGETYALMTVFNPISIAADLMGDRRALLDHMKQDPQAVHGALGAITETFTQFARKSLEEGACGIFFATTDWASRDYLNEEAWEEWGRPYDLRILETVQDAPFNVLHVCKENNLLYCLADYPVHAINWDTAGAGNPNLRDVQLNTDKAVIGGLSLETLQNGTPAHITAEARLAREQTGGRRWMLGPACAIAIDTPEENIRAARQAADNVMGAV
jgi:uroporphyrinogen decarboxylase